MSARVVPTLLASLALASAQPIAAEAAEIPERLGSDLEGNAIETSSFRGKVLLVSLWASWCRECLSELPVLEVLQREYVDGEVVILALNAGESRLKVQSFLERHPLSLAVGLDASGKVRRRLRTRVLPVHALVHPSGTLCSVYRDRKSVV